MNSFHWEIYLQKYPDLKGLKTKAEAYNHYIHYGIYENRNDHVEKKYILLYDRPDRLGANITCYVAQILYAIHNGISIKFDDRDYRYFGSPFVKCLFDWITSNISSDGTHLIEYCNTADYTGLIGETTQNIQSDFFTYFKKHVTISFNIEYPISFDITKCILIHLRLEDVRESPDYDGTFCTEFYRERVENGKYCFYTSILPNQKQGNKQAPISKEKLETVIANAKERFPEYSVTIVTNPNEPVDLGYPVIQSQDENYDFYLLTKAPVVILSRSTFSLSALFFGNHEAVYIPSWGHSVCMGLNTKFDNSDFKYFY